MSFCKYCFKDCHCVAFKLVLALDKSINHLTDIGLNSYMHARILSHCKSGFQEIISQKNLSKSVKYHLFGPGEIHFAGYRPHEKDSP